MNGQYIQFNNIKSKISPEGLDYLVENNLMPLDYKHNRNYDVNTGALLQEATIIWILPQSGKEEITQELFSTWINA